MGRVSGRVLVTGANRGIGFAIVKAICENPRVTKIYAATRVPDNAKKLQELAAIHPKIRILELDVTKDWSIKTSVEIIRSEGETLNVLVNNAGILDKQGGSVVSGDRDVWMRHFDVNVVSHAMVTQTCLPLLHSAVGHHEPASVVTISGRMGSIEHCAGSISLKDDNIAYGCSKAAANFFSRCLSFDHPEILFVSMCPGWVKTDMGGSEGLFDTDEAVLLTMQTVDGLDLSSTGKFLNRKGNPIAF